MMRFCHGPHCDARTKQETIFRDGKPYWLCDNCGLETPRVFRRSKKQKERDRLFDELSKPKE